MSTDDKIKEILGRAADLLYELLENNKKIRAESKQLVTNAVHNRDQEKIKAIINKITSL